ncbi:hypothetical protein [uncultured Maribacter sp.]|uniref:hypothetical protein n=1 Tax=uncultured Maribacter sp. TaxID=431308 RepID=UPI002610D81E|nr:hypothetical protein [uncultured Maribacter sp.]
MKQKLHPLVQKTKVELKRLDKIKDRRSWEEQKKYNGEFLPISVEPKLRARALKFMSDLIYLLEADGHGIKYEYDRCHIEMYDQLTEINLRQKYFRKRTENSSGYSTETYEKSDKLEFQIGYHARKGWIDRKTKCLEDYLQVIYDYLEKDSKEWADLRERQRIQKEKDKILKEQEAEKARLMAIETEKLEKLISDAENYEKAVKIRTYLKALEEKINSNNELSTSEGKEYLKWAYQKADDIDPLSSI